MDLTLILLFFCLGYKAVHSGKPYILLEINNDAN